MVRLVSASLCSSRPWRLLLSIFICALALAACSTPVSRTAPAPVPAGAPEKGAKVPGSGGFSHQVPIALRHSPGSPPPGTASNPLRIMLIGDSVMYVAAPAIEAAFDSTGAARVFPRALPGWGLTTAGNWRTELPLLVSELHPELVIGMWSWDDNEALDHPSTYRRMLEEAIDLMLAPGNGVDGIMFMQFPPLGPLPAYMKDAKADEARRDAGEAAWSAIADSMTSVYPGRVMYLPIARAVELDGKFTPWLPPLGDPSAPPRDWVRVRMVDNVHLCPPGAVRYADALLADLTALYHLPPAKPGWPTGAWTSDHRYRDPPGSCPDDHPPLGN